MKSRISKGGYQKNWTYKNICGSVVDGVIVVNKVGLKKMLEKIDAIDDNKTVKGKSLSAGKTQISFMLATDTFNQIKKHSEISKTKKSTIIQYALELFNEKIEKVLIDG